MAGGLLRRKAVIAVEQESVEGTAETLANADGTMLAYDHGFDDNTELFVRQPARAFLGTLAPIPGRLPGVIRWRTELKGSGALSTRPAWDDALRACGFTISTVHLSATSSSVTGGPFYPTEFIQTASRDVVGRLVGSLQTGDTEATFVPTSGTFGAESVVGRTSGATTMLRGVPTADSGFEYRPLSSSVPSATVGYYLDGTRQILAGARGNVRIETGAVGEPVFLAFEFMGVTGTAIDTTLLAPTYESTVPKAFLSVRPVVLGYTSPIIASMTFDMQNELAMREDASLASGIKSYIITNRAPQLEADPEMELIATHDFYGSLHAGTTGRSYFQVGSGSTGERITCAFPKCQYRTVAEGDRSSLAVSQVTMDVLSSDVSTGDDEVQIAMI